MHNPLLTIAAKDMRDATRDRFLLIVTGFLILAALTALITGAIALSTDVATYEAAKASLLALGKSAASIKPPEFYPMRLLRGAVEQIEIVGSAIAILIGFRAASAERGRQTMALILTRPIKRWQFTGGKIVAGVALLAFGLGVVMGLCAVLLHLMSGIGLTGNDLGRIGLVWAVSVVYMASFFLAAFLLTLHLSRPSTALLIAFSLWLVIVLVAPQIGDTMDPDNQVAGGVFKALSISGPDQLEIMKTYAGFEAVRNGIEIASITKHFERFAFAVLGIKATYAGLPLGPILTEKALDVLWIILAALGLASLALALPLNTKTLSQE
ncbi:MAG: ABC transporter permease subunit [Paracoccaceae bacterium]|jgi:ABC-type transport system involved in multi-copper enzyme maturation permease subunit